MEDDSPALRLADVAVQIRRRWRVLAATAVLCLVGALAFGLVRGPSYTATAVVTVDPSGDSDEVNIATERTVATSADVATRVATSVDGTASPTELLERISVRTPTDANVIEIDASADDASRAAALANAFAQGYLHVRSAGATSLREERLTTIGERIDELMAQLPPNVVGDAGPGPAAESIRHEIDSLRDTRSELTATAIDPGRVITTAVPPRQASSLGFGVLGAGGLGLGLLLGTGLALIRERTDRRVRDADRLAHVIGMSVVGHTPGHDSDLAGRLLLRMGLNHDTPTGTMVVLGADSASAAAVSTILTNHLTSAGTTISTQHHYTAHREPSTAQSPGKRRAGAVTARLFMFSNSAAYGVAQAVATARGADHVIVTAGASAEIAVTKQLIDELALANTPVHAVAVSSTTIPTSADGERNTAPTTPGGSDISDEPTRFIDVERSSPSRPANAGRPSRRS